MPPDLIYLFGDLGMKLIIDFYDKSTIFSLMPTVIKDFKYADSHEWVKVDGNSATVGITDHAQDHLGDVVYVELPEVGANVTQGGSFGAVESVKATSDINSPVSGKVVEVNGELNSSPALVSVPPTHTFFVLFLCTLNFA